MLGQAQVKGDITAVAPPAPGQKLIAYGFADGKAQVVQPYFKVSYPNDVRVIEPSLQSPFGEEPVVVDPQGKALTLMVFEATKDKMATAAVTADGRGVMAVMSGEENFLSGDIEWSAQNYSIPSLPRHVDQMLLTPTCAFCSCAKATASPSTTFTTSMTSPCAMSWRSTPPTPT